MYHWAFGSPWASKVKINAYIDNESVFWPCMHVNLFLSDFFKNILIYVLKMNKGLIGLEWHKGE